MYVCICKRVTSSDLVQDYDSAIALCGTGCGACIPFIEAGVYPGTDVRIKELLAVSTTKDAKSSK